MLFIGFRVSIQPSDPPAAYPQTSPAGTQHLPVQLASGLSDGETTGSSGRQQHFQHRHAENRGPPGPRWKEIIVETPSIPCEPLTALLRSSAKFLGVQISQVLFWNINITSLAKKAQQRFVPLWKLRRARAPNPMCSFYRGTIESILTCCITVWCGSLEHFLQCTESIWEDDWCLSSLPIGTTKSNKPLTWKIVGDFSRLWCSGVLLVPPWTQLADEADHLKNSNSECRIWLNV